MEFPRRRFLHLAAGAAALPAFSRSARAEAYPTKPVRLIVQVPAGSAPDIIGRQTRSHGLHALTLARQQQSGAVGFQRGIAISVPCGFRQAVRVCRKALLLWAWRDEP